MDNQERYNQLKQKIGEVKYMSLSPEEKAEYTELKKEFGEAKPEAKSSEEDRIAKLEQLVNSLTSENSNLKKETAKLQEGWAEYKPVAAQNKTATLKIYRKDSDSPEGVIVKVVVFKNNELDEETNKRDKLVYNASIRYDDGKIEVVKMDAKALSELREIEKVEIIKEDRRTLRKVDDYVVLPERDKEGFPKRVLSGGNGYGQSIGKGKVPLEVFMVKSTVTVKRHNGQEFQMEGDFLNL